MTVIALGIILFLILWAFAPLRALFPYLFIPILVLGAFVFLLGVSSAVSF